MSLWARGFGNELREETISCSQAGFAARLTSPHVSMLVSSVTGWVRSVWIRRLTERTRCGAPRPPYADARQVWEAEITKRLDELETGKVRTVDADEALHRIDGRLRGG